MSDSQDDNTEPPPAGKKPPRGMDAVVMRELRRARKLFKDGEPTPEAEFVVASAHVVALLDLAAAIREHGGSAPSTEDDA